MLKSLINSMRLRTLPLSLAGVVCGGLPALGRHDNSWLAFALVLLTACLLQILSNLSNELGDHLSGVDGEDREGPKYSMADGGLTVGQMWRAINWTVVACCVCGLLMLLFSFQFRILNYQFFVLLLLGVAAIWAATHYTLGKNPYGYKGLGDLFVFLFFGLASVMGSYFVLAHTLALSVVPPAVGCGLLSVAVLNVNNIRDMASDEGIRKTIPLSIGERNAKIYQTCLIAGGYLCYLLSRPAWYIALLSLPFAAHVILLWRRHGSGLDPLLPLLVISTFVLSLIYALIP